MEENFEELKALKELLESGAISKVEYDRMKADLLQSSMASDGVKSAMQPSKFKSFIGRYKWLLLALPLVLIGVYFIWQSQQADPKLEGENLADKFCDCQIQNNQEYINQLNNFLQTFDSQKYEYSKDVKKKLDQLSNEYSANSLTVSISTCFNNFKIEQDKMKNKFGKDNEKIEEFSFAFQTKITKNIDLISQEQEIPKLQEAANQKMSSMVYSNASDLKNRKNTIYYFMNDFYSAYSGGYADAYNFFVYNVEQYINQKNITPTDINLLLKKQSDYIDQMFKIASETLNLVKSEKGIETWEYAAEFQCFRTSLEKYQISNVWYEIKLNESGKLVSYKERSVEKSKFFTPEEYNLMNNRENGESDW